jgi:hypothetical protein
MPAIYEFVSQAFCMPGKPAAATDLRRDAAESHRHIMDEVVQEDSRREKKTVNLITDILETRSTAETSILCHPLLVEALHSIADRHASLKRWHLFLASPSMLDIVATPDTKFSSSLGNILFALQLHAVGHDTEARLVELGTDLFGRIRFPFSPWNITVQRCAQGETRVLSRKRIVLTLEPARVLWFLDDEQSKPFLITTRKDCVALVTGTLNDLDPRQVAFPHPGIRPSIQRTTPLGRSGVSYDPISFQDFDAHAGMTGAVVDEVLAAVELHSPGIYHEFCNYMTTVRGFELPADDCGTVGSFSDPTLPGVMSINIPYNSDDEPCISPYCFTWFGHELAHTKVYFAESIAYQRGWHFATNRTEQTELLPRYGRQLPVRTLIQVPYVHLYEWVLLMDFMAGGLHQIPWRMEGDPKAIGDDLQNEIKESFGCIGRCADLTSLGKITMSHVHDLFDDASERWRVLKSV